MRAVDSLPIPAEARAPLRVLNQDLADKLALANDVVRFLRPHGCRLLAVSLEGKRPRLTLERFGGPLLVSHITNLVYLREEPGTTRCRAFFMGCEIEWLCPNGEAH